MKCPSCAGSGSSFLDVDSKLYGEISIHEHCGSCAGSGSGLVEEAAREIDDALWVTLRSLTPEADARKRRETIARFVASALARKE